MTSSDRPVKSVSEAWTDVVRCFERTAAEFAVISERWRRTVSVLLPLPDEDKPGELVWTGETWQVTVVDGEVNAVGWGNNQDCVPEFAAAMIAADRACKALPKTAEQPETPEQDEPVAAEPEAFEPAVDDTPTMQQPVVGAELVDDTSSTTEPAAS